MTFDKISVNIAILTTPNTIFKIFLKSNDCICIPCRKKLGQIVKMGLLITG